MRFGGGGRRSALAFRKRMQTLRIPADDTDCECGDYILTETGEPIQSEASEKLERAAA